MATETHVTKASCSQVHGRAVGPGTVPMGSPLGIQEDKALDLRGWLSTGIPLDLQVHGLRSLQRVHLLVFCFWPSSAPGHSKRGQN